MLYRLFMDHKTYSSAKPIPIPSAQETGEARNRSSNLIVGSIQSDWDVVAQYHKAFPSSWVKNPEGTSQVADKEGATEVKERE